MSKRIASGLMWVGFALIILSSVLAAFLTGPAATYLVGGAIVGGVIFLAGLVLVILVTDGEQHRQSSH